MKTKNYFNRIMSGMLCACLVFSLFISVAYYFISRDRIVSDFYYEKEAESKGSITELKQQLERCTDAAKLIAEKIGEYENGSITKENLFAQAQKISGQGNVYIIGEYVLKSDNAPEINESLYDRVRNITSDEFVFGLNSGAYVAVVNRAERNDGRNIFVMRTYREDLFFEENEATAMTVFGDGDPIHIGADAACRSVEMALKDNSKQELINRIASRKFKSDDYIFVLQKLGYGNNSEIVFAYSDQAIDAQKTGILMTCVAVFFILFVLTGLLSIIPAKIVYHPMDELVAFAGRYTHEKDKSDEIAYISGAMKTLEEKNKDLIEDSNKTKELLKTQFMKDLLAGVISETEYYELAEEYKMTEHETPFYVGIFEISDYDNMLEAFGEKNLIQIKRQIGSFIGDELKGRSVGGAVEMDKKRFAVVTCGCDISRVRQNFSYIISVINSEFDVEMFSAISKKCDSLYEIGEGYQLCTKTFEDSFAIGFRGGVVTADEIDAGSGFYYPVNLERDLISCVIRLKREESFKIINSILDENLNGKTLTKERCNAIGFAFTATINRIVEALNKSIDEIYGEDNIVFLELKMCKEAEGLREKVVQSFDRIMNYMSGDEDADLSQRFLDYIHSHYNEDVSLTEIGAHFKRSECYISTMFKEITGENFKDYLSRYRIKKAKEILMKNPDIKTKELASMIGCNTVATLFRLFNKYEGMSPGQFVKNNLKND